ncbi:carbohydrate binding domain-containing protein [Streptomyces sp. L7]
MAAGSYPITVTGTAATGSHTATYTLTVTSSTGGGGGGSLTNAGFETGSLSPWTCTGGSAVVSSPVHSGSHSLQVTPSASSTGECDQTVALSPNKSYTLTAWVQGPYAYLGVSGGASASTWSNSTSWNQLSVSFTTGSSGTVTVYVHGWYGQSNVTADDFTLG